MKLKNIIDEDFVNYKKPSMFLIFPNCTFKCGRDICQNISLIKEKNIEISTDKIIERYLNNPITKAVVCGGLEPMDSWDDLRDFIFQFRYFSKDDIVIYTGYEEDEIKDKIKWFKTFGPIVIKFGRYNPNYKNYYNEILGVKLVGKNQYAKRYE